MKKIVEYLAILSQLTIFVFFSYFPINSSTSKYFLSSSKNLSTINYFIINLSILMTILLAASFTRFGLDKVFIILLIFYILLFLISFKDILTKNYKDNFLIILIFIIINFALFADIARDLQLNWDALTRWKLKANYFYNGNNYFDITKDVDFPHPQYPHLGTIFGLFLEECNFIMNIWAELFKPIYTLFLCLFSGIFWVQSNSKIFILVI